MIGLIASAIEAPPCYFYLHFKYSIIVSKNQVIFSKILTYQIRYARINLMKRLIILFLMFVLWFTAASFAETSIKAEVDNLIVTTDNTLIYKIIISSSERQIPRPELPDFKGFDVISQAQSSTVSFVKGSTQTVSVYAFILAPLGVGKFKIPPATIKINGLSISAQEFEIEVTQGKTEIKPGLEHGLSPDERQPKIDTRQPQYTL